MAIFRWLNTSCSTSWLFVTGTLALFLLLTLKAICNIAYFAIFGSSLTPDWQGLGEMNEEEQIGFLAFSLCFAPFGCLVEELIFGGGWERNRSRSQELGVFVLKVAFLQTQLSCANRARLRSETIKTEH